MNHITSLIFQTWLQFLVRYRRTFIGPLWIVVGPSLFVLTLGLLFSQISGAKAEVFIPHLTIGLVVWTLVSGFVNGSTTVFQRSRAQILQGGMNLLDVVFVDVTTTVFHFVHQIIIIGVVFLIFHIPVTVYALVSLIGLFLLFANGVWLAVLFGIIGARYRDLVEVTQAVMRIAFLVTPIIWMVGEQGRGGILGVFLVYYPFYHFLELIRAPLLNNPIQPLSWIVVLSITFSGVFLARYYFKRYSGQVALWI
ncbi:MAG: ABC transporter permease [Alphaproteobacteria bacterium]|nr:ABC transporter permease [Alphaproteobacteria bacterium]